MHFWERGGQVLSPPTPSSPFGPTHLLFLWGSLDQPMHIHVAVRRYAFLGEGRTGPIPLSVGCVTEGRRILDSWILDSVHRHVHMHASWAVSRPSDHGSWIIGFWILLRIGMCTCMRAGRSVGPWNADAVLKSHDAWFESHYDQSEWGDSEA